MVVCNDLCQNGTMMGKKARDVSNARINQSLCSIIACYLFFEKAMSENLKEPNLGEDQIGTRL